MGSRLVIYAPSIRSGGGLVLLQELMNSLQGRSDVFLYCHHSIFDFLSGQNPARTVQVHGLLDRFVKETCLALKLQAGDELLCMGNLPLMFRTSASTTVFIQNRFLVDNALTLRHLGLKSILSHILQRLYLSLTSRNIDTYIVQSLTMKRLLHSRLPRANVLIKPVVQKIIATRMNRQVKDVPKKYDLIYPATLAQHKNHLMLVNALAYLSTYSIYPSTLLVVGSSPAQNILRKVIGVIEAYELKVRIEYDASLKSVYGYYMQSKALVYPSLVESFGLPLVEASKLSLPILCSDLDYVYDVCRPDFVFNPNSVASIGYAIAKFLGYRLDILPYFPVVSLTVTE